MSKTVSEIGMIVGGLAVAAIPGMQWAGIIALAAPAPVMSAMFGIGISVALSGVGIALRPTPAPVGGQTAIAFNQGVSPRRVVYGQFQTAGVLTYASFPPSQNQSTTNQYLHLIFTLTAHEITSFDAIAIDGCVYNFGTDILWDATSGYWHVDPLAAGSLSDFYWQHILFEFDFGRNLSVQPFPQLAAADSSWTSACVQQGCSKVHVVLRADDGWPAVFPSGQIPNFQFLITGKKLIDPRIITAWQGSTSYLKYQWFQDNRGFVWVQTNTSGTSSLAASRPNFEGSGSSWPVTVTDNTLSWTTWGQNLATIETCIDSAPQGHIFKARLVNDVWQPSASYPQNAIIEAPIGYLQQQTSASGTTGTAEPNFSTTLGGTTSDGTQAWVCLGRSPHAINPSNNALCVYDYLQDPDAGMGVAAVAGIDTATTQAVTGAPGTMIVGVGSITGMFIGMVLSIDSGANQEDITLTNIGSPGSPDIIAYFTKNHSAGAPVTSINPSQNPIDVPSVIAAANVCEEQVVIIVNADSSVVYENLYSCNGTFDYSSVRGNVLSSLCSSMAGWVIPPGDMWHVFAGAYVTPTIGLTDADMRGPIKGDFRISKREVANSIKGKYVPAFLPSNPAAALSLTQIPPTWHQQSFPPYQANGLAGKPNYLNLEDGGQIIWQDVTFDFCTSIWLAQRLAKITLMRLRFQETLNLACKMTAFALEAGDTFYFTHSRWSILGGVYQASQCSISFDSGGGKDAAPVIGVDLVARQVDPSIYSFTPPSSSTNYGEYSPYGITGVMTGVE